MIDELEDALSLERFARYVDWAGGDRARALELYTLNTSLSEALYTPLQALEVALRNRIHGAMSEAYGGQWFEPRRWWQIQRPRILKLRSQDQQVFDAISELEKAGKDITPGRVVAALTFSFWTAMITSKEYEELWRKVLYKIAKRPDGAHLSRKDLSRPLTQLRLLRNRIAHHEPILSWKLVKHRDAALEITSWLSPPTEQWCRGIERFGTVYPAGGYTLDTGAQVKRGRV